MYDFLCSITNLISCTCWSAWTEDEGINEERFQINLYVTEI